jgi:predicted NBD/HSP70 family sugar kinase
VTGLPPAGLIAGVDIGGTKTLAVALTSDGATVATVRRPTVFGSAAELLTSTVDLLHVLATRAGEDKGRFTSIGVGIPGLIDRTNGSVRHAVNLALGEEPVELGDHLERAFGVPVVVDNDVNVGVVGAAAALGHKGNLAYLSIGTGVAAGFLVGGRVHRGAHGAAGEIGHLPVDPTGPLCECGQRGCLEAVASGSAIARRWRNGDTTSAAVSELLGAASAGDQDAIALRDEVASHLAWAVALIAQTVDPDVIVLGGGAFEAGEQMLDSVLAALRHCARSSPVLAALDLAARTQSVPAGVPAGALGAALLAHELLAKAPVEAAASRADE